MPRGIWLYTGLFRAKQLAILVWSKEGKSVWLLMSQQRYTLLSSTINQFFKLMLTASIRHYIVPKVLLKCSDD